MKVLIIDDSVLFRILLSNLIRDIDGAEICGTASDGEAGLAAIEKHRPDVVLLDVEMPKVTGLEVMQELHRKGNEVKVIMCSAFTVAGAEVTVKALELGAHDFITKPEGKNRDESLQQLREQLVPGINEIKAAQTGGNKVTGTVGLTGKTFSGAKSPKNKHAEIVGIGISTGGPKALGIVLSQLPADFKRPIVIVQHMPKIFIESLVVSLNQKCQMSVKVGEHGHMLEEGTIYLAPGEKQMAIEVINGKKVIQLSDDAPENFCKPAADYLFRSLARNFKSKAIGIVMTGMGNDGAQGLLEMKNAGAYTIAQDKETSTIYGMPQEAFKVGAVQTVLPLSQIAGHLQESIA